MHRHSSPSYWRQLERGLDGLPKCCMLKFAKWPFALRSVPFTNFPLNSPPLLSLPPNPTRGARHPPPPPLIWECSDLITLSYGREGMLSCQKHFRSIFLWRCCLSFDLIFLLTAFLPVDLLACSAQFICCLSLFESETSNIALVIEILNNFIFFITKKDLFFRMFRSQRC